MIFDLASRWFLLLFLLLPVLWWRWLDPRYRTTVRFSSVATLQGIRPTWAVAARWVLPALRTLTVTVLILAMIRPQKPNEQTRIFSEGIAIELLVDRSGSMQAMDFKLDGKSVDRLTVVKKVVRDFVRGDDRLEGRPDDLIGLIAYGTYADSRCPLTLDHDYLIEAMDKTEIALNREEGQTAIGDAVALGVERLQSLDRQRRQARLNPVKSRVMVLLTDGESNAGVIEPLKAAEVAATYGIRVYTIGVGTEGMAPFPMIDAFGRRRLVQQPVSIDEETLRKIADTTRGQYFRANDTESLRNVYAEIDKLEKTRTEEKRYLQTTELATTTVKLGPVTVPPLLLCAFVLLAMEIVLASTRFRRLP